MALVTGFTAERSLVIEKSAITGAYISGTDLILVPTGFATEPLVYPEINVGNVQGIQGIQGPIGEVSQVDHDADLADVYAAIAAAHAAGAISTSQLADASVTLAKLAANSVGTTQLVNLAVTNAKLGADSVNGSKIADSSIDSEHYVNGSIDLAHLASESVNHTKLLNSLIGGGLHSNKISYHKLLGTVYVSGRGCTRTTPSVATLSTNYRPASDQMFPCVYGTLVSGGGPTAFSGSGPGVMIIRSDGTIDTGQGGSGGDQCWFSASFPSAT